MANAQLLRFGNPILGAEGNMAAGNFTLNQATDQAEWVFETDEAAVITRVGFRYGSRTGTPPTYVISLQGVDSSGNPDGTIKGGASPASATFTPPADTSWNGDWQWITLSNSYACARDEALALVIGYSSGTVDVSNNSSFTIMFTMGMAYNFPYGIQNDAATRSRQAQFAVFGYGSSSKAYGHPVQNITNQLFNSGSTPNEYALGYALPSSWFSTYQVIGVDVVGILPLASTLDIVHYTGATAQQQATHDTDLSGNPGNYRKSELYFGDASLATLTAGNTYRLSLLPGSASTGILILEVASAADFEAYPGGQLCWLSTRVGAGSWADTATKRPLLDMILADITPPSGGFITSGDFAGGYNG